MTRGNGDGGDIGDGGDDRLAGEDGGVMDGVDCGDDGGVDEETKRLVRLRSSGFVLRFSGSSVTREKRG